jgi:hypothetical protein
VIAHYDSRGNFFRLCRKSLFPSLSLSLSLSPSRTCLAVAFPEIKRADPQSPPRFRVLSFPARLGVACSLQRGDYISLQCALSILSYILQRASGTETWARPLIGSVSERTVRTASKGPDVLSLFLSVPPARPSLPDGRTDGRTGWGCDYHFIRV